jgi:protein tyrosine/serine phosphatase
MKFRFDTTKQPQRLWAWLYAFVQEHNFTNLIRFNFHRVDENMYRSSQPTMWQLERVVKKHGIKTILNLKGVNPNSAYYLFEKEKCQELGIKMVDITVFSRAIPNHEKIAELKELFENIEYPAWMHCKAGADRTGLVATLYQHYHLGQDIKDTNQLGFFPFGHVKYSKAGRIDFFFEEYVKFSESNPDIDLLTWSKDYVDKDEMIREFKPNPIANFINDKILRRE